MFQDYTIGQLLELRAQCLNRMQDDEDLSDRADALIILRYVEEELGLRQHMTTA